MAGTYEILVCEDGKGSNADFGGISEARETAEGHLHSDKHTKVEDKNGKVDPFSDAHIRGYIRGFAPRQCSHKRQERRSVLRSREC